jgi:hypothetical protein
MAGTSALKHVGRVILVSLVVALLSAAGASGVAWSIRVGGGGEDTFRDVAVSPINGLIYATGGASGGFPTTPGAYDQTYNGSRDVIVTAWDAATGQLVYSTYIGAAQYDRAYAVEIGPDGSVYIGGRAGKSFPTTPGAFQPQYRGYYTGSGYGDQNAFACRFSADLRTRLWCSYIGTLDAIRDLAVDEQGEVYVAGWYQQGTMPAGWFTGAYQPTPAGGRDLWVAKIAADGTAVRWATFLGGSGTDGETPSIRVGSDHAPVVLTGTSSRTLRDDLGRGYRGGTDFYLAKVSADGSRLLFGAYLGGSGGEGLETHELAIRGTTHAVIAATTNSRDFPVTPGAWQPAYGGSGGSGNYYGDGVIAVINMVQPAIEALTYLGGSSGEGIEGVAVASDGSVCVSGATFSADFDVTADAAQASKSGGADAFLACLSPDLTTLQYGSYQGGGGDDFGRAMTLTTDDRAVTVGMTSSGNWLGTKGSGGGWDAFISAW